MKVLIKELAKREGKKSQVKIGDLRETMSKLLDIVAEEFVNAAISDISGQPQPFPKFTDDMINALIKKCNSVFKKKKRDERFSLITFDNKIFVKKKT